MHIFNTILGQTDISLHIYFDFGAIRHIYMHISPLWGKQRIINDKKLAFTMTATAIYGFGMLTQLFLFF